MKDTNNASIRIHRHEWEYLKKHNYSPSDYWHKSIQRDMDLETRNKWQNKIQNYSFSLIEMALGAFFLFLTTTINNLASIIIVLLIGIFLSVTGGATILLEGKKHAR